MAGGPAATLNHEVTSKMKTHVCRAEEEEEAGSAPPATTTVLLHCQPRGSVSQQAYLYESEGVCVQANLSLTQLSHCGTSMFSGH